MCSYHHDTIQKLDHKPSSSNKTNLFALRSQMIRQDLTTTLGIHSTWWSVAAAEAVFAVVHSQKVIFVHQCFAAAELVFAGPLAQP
jgi:hypothetical protein